MDNAEYDIVEAVSKRRNSFLDAFLTDIDMTTKEYDPTKDSLPILQAKLTGHVLLKGFQSGACVGALVAFPLQSLVLKRAPFSFQTCINTTGVSALVGTFLCGILMAGKATQIKDREGYEDRVYRLYYNQGQNRVDQWSAIGAGAGLALGFKHQYGFLKAAPASLVGAASLGAAGGVLLHLIIPMKKE